MRRQHPAILACRILPAACFSDPWPKKRPATGTGCHGQPIWSDFSALCDSQFEPDPPKESARPFLFPIAAPSVTIIPSRQKGRINAGRYLPGSVTVAQEILALLVLVRIQAG